MRQPNGAWAGDRGAHLSTMRKSCFNGPCSRQRPPPQTRSAAAEPSTLARGESGTGMVESERPGLGASSSCLGTTPVERRKKGRWLDERPGAAGLHAIQATGAATWPSAAGSRTRATATAGHRTTSGAPGGAPPSRLHAPGPTVTPATVTVPSAPLSCCWNQTSSSGGICPSQGCSGQRARTGATRI